MSETTFDTTPYWTSTATAPRFPKIGEDLEADVVVVGGGVTGLTAAYLLAKGGRTVVVLERRRCAQMDTGHTSAHLAMVTDTRLTELVQRFGRDHAQAAWDAGLAAIATIEDIVREHAIAADFQRVEGYLHVPRDGSAGASPADLQAEAERAREMGFDAAYVDEVPLVRQPGVRVSDQARIQPRAYLAGVARACADMGVRIHEHSPGDECHDEPLEVTSLGHTVRCKDLVIATHTPIVGVASQASAALFQTKLALYTTYVIAGRVPKGTVPDALWWDTKDPYDYLRVEPRPRWDVVIFGGGDHKTGQVTDTTECYRRLEGRLRAIVPDVELTHRWSGQVIETPDGLPYIGRSADHQYTATGFAGNGLTFGTLAGMMISEAILGQANPWVDLFDPGRKALTRGLWDYVKENVDYPYYMIRDRIAGDDGGALRDVPRGEGRVIERHGAKVAAYRDEAGAVTLRSAICPHMGCTVAWNTAERTWDCPCHGSRFTPAGDVLAGPAESPLAKAE